MSDVNGYEKYNDYLFLNTGSPHLVKFVDDVSSLDLINISRNIQKSNRFDNGVNVNLVSRKNDNLYQIRTYERGVEDETLSCGTGAVASALALNILSLINSKTVNLDTKGGLLTVDFNKSNSKYTDIHLSGKVKKVFTGILEL
jgi:diaminopimelate epimerase